MAKTNNSDKPQETTMKTKTAKQRRALLKKLGRFAAVTAPTVTLLLAAQTKPGGAAPISCAPSSRAFKITEGPVNLAAVLAGVIALPTRVWRDK
jgi:hypothetical protein